ncbi:nitrate reductase molybdenum cofactor assembly chaperone [Klebsiella pneumoniae]|uniref:nitrate reductase molybdenum cofactor assembly chaperone n=1 Tax=Klebsiella pneumoniae TaxID=573 RepID=UPI00259ED31E|nr:nitrate reductase molybdenum cofactor assembly chaperone [Klebsiella pneumoniae]EKT9159412.1 nitrate reductase molybdenum cofactor assembly chaperone [Klebsiella pneumoniae]EKV7228647.1 nitrate reductase molybdenum cofactor assembly chaperone [Klebsiella pneumoniae]ELA1514474.1 nitrate reductase molybdenum cofactor assembly chaperone [Klebsiella pneumoniae]EMF2014757.1 nitrate reductase molybdenum cofactor assembly chaperone [Klebsiella pneumoniae]WRP59973.1 nitrate reductase molybdenum cof
MIELVIVSRLLEYPDAALWQHQQEMFEALASSEKLSKEDAHALGVFLRDLVAQDPLDAQAAYSELFDRGRATSLLLFEHVHGESRDRGQAMVDLMAQYERHGLLLDSHELPDHLPLYLEYLAQLPEEEALGGLRDVAPILGLLSARLQQRESRYAVLFELLLKLANTQVDSQKVAEKIADEARDDTPQALDAVWEEEQVKFFADQGCGESEISARQRRFAGAVAPQYLNISNGGQQ